MKKVMALTIILCLLFGTIGCSEVEDYSKQLENANTDNSKENSQDEGKLEFGELIDLKETCIDYNDDLSCKSKILVINAKIKSSATKKMTVNQNYHSMFEYIKKNISNTDTYEEIQYWAIADMNNGKEAKVISFTVPKETITKVLNGSIQTATDFSENLEDLFVHSSLK